MRARRRSQSVRPKQCSPTLSVDDSKSSIALSVFGGPELNKKSISISRQVGAFKLRRLPILVAFAVKFPPLYSSQKVGLWSEYCVCSR